MSEYVFMNGEYIEADKASLPVRTHAFLYGTSVFEGIRAYYNKDEDDVENGIVGGLIEPTPEEVEGLIKGDTFIKPKVEYKYSYAGNDFS